MQKSTQHTFSSAAMKKGKRNGLFRHREPVKCVIEPLKWRWFALCGKSINNDLIDNDKRVFEGTREKKWEKLFLS